VLGLTAIAIVAASAGFLAASLPTASAPEQAAIEPGQARLVPAPTTLTVTATGDDPGRLIVFDDQARFQRSLTLDPPTGTQTIELADEAAIVLVPRASSPIAVTTPSAPDTTLDPIPTHETPRPLTDERAGTVDRELTLAVPNRPASLGLVVDGEAEGLHVSVRTAEGPVLQQTNTSTLGDAPGQFRLDPNNLANGTYRVSVHVDRLEGSIHLLTRTLSVDDRRAGLSAPDDRLEAMGELIAEVHQGQAWRLPTAQTDELTLALERGARADVRLYGPDHRVHRELELGQRGPDWRWSSNDSQAPTYQTATLATPEDAYTVYADAIDADVDRVLYVLAPNGTQPHPGHPATVETRSVDVPHETADGRAPEETIGYAGGLLDVAVTDGDGSALDRRVTVEGPAGTVLERRDRASADGRHVLTTRAEHVERFGTAPLEISVDAEAASGSVELTIRHYAP